MKRKPSGSLPRVTTPPDSGMQLRLETQVNPVADEVGATTAVVRPILLGTLYALKQDVVKNQGGY